MLKKYKQNSKRILSAILVCMIVIVSIFSSLSTNVVYASEGNGDLSVDLKVVDLKNEISMYVDLNNNLENELITLEDIRLIGDMDKNINYELKQMKMGICSLNQPTILEIINEDGFSQITYQINDKRISVYEYADGKMAKYIATYDDDKLINFVDNFNNEKIVNFGEEALKSTMEVLEENSQYIKGKNQNIMEKSIFDSAKEVDPYPLEEIEYEVKMSQRAYFSELDNLGYQPYQNVVLYESEMYFDDKRVETAIFDAGECIQLVASWWNISKNATIGFLGVAGVLYDTYGYLNEKIKPIKEHEIYFGGGIEVTVDDPTMTNGNWVEVVNEWSDGIYSLGYDREYNSFTNAEWKITSKPNSFDTSYEDYIDLAIERYNMNIQMNGQWIHGRGRLGY